MRSYSLAHVSDGDLLRGLADLVRRDRVSTAEMLAHIAEVDTRRLYLPAACSSMHDYCVRELGLSEDSAAKRIQSARAARRFPAIFEALADGRLHLSAVAMLAPHLTVDSADGLLAAAAHKTKAEIELLLANWFPRPDVPTSLRAVTPAPVSLPLVEQHAPGHAGMSLSEHVPAQIETPHPKVAPLSPQRFALQVTIGEETRAKLRYAQELLSHRVESGDVAEVLDRALTLLIARLEKRKFAATGTPRPRGRTVVARRTIPAEVRRAVWARDGGRCTYVSEDGRRCVARARLEFDHIEPVACGGKATVDGIRLRCRAHNQYAAERVFGTEFMEAKRRRARGVAGDQSTPRATMG